MVITLDPELEAVLNEVVRHKRGCPGSVGA